MPKPTNELAVIAEESQLSNGKVQELLSNFGESFNQAKQLAEGATAIVVTDEKQTKLMGDARAKRLQLKNIRVEVEKTRKSLKEQSLREGKAIDGMANIIKALIMPVEEHLEQQERFAERAAAERKHKRHIERIEKLSPFVDNINVFNLEEMADDEFETLVKQSEDAFKAKQAAERQAALDRQAAIEAEEKRQQDVAAENARLKKEAEAKEVEAAKERAAADAKLKAEREANEKKLAAERAKADAAQKAKDDELRAEREKRAEIERKQAETAAAEAKAKAEAEERERQELLAPDQEKLVKFAMAIGTIRKEKLPAVKTKQAQDVVNLIDEKLRSLQAQIVKAAEVL